MSTDKDKAKIPQGRVSRFAKMGSLASRVAGSMMAEGVTQLAQGKRPKIKDLLLTPGNAMRVADQLAQLRGAAMKVGQLISMDAGDVLPEELTDLLARLRSDAKAMPKQELFALMQNEWGENWRDKFIQFDIEPIAAASIGQVHKAISKDLERMAVKIQYPGIKQSINSDVDNVASLIKLTGLLPPKLDIKPLLKEAKHQLHEEADYQLEAKRLNQYAEVVQDDERFVMPKVVPEYCTSNVLAMTFVDGIAIESLASEDYSQAIRNQVVESLFALLFKELFEFKLVQTDPNFANYQFDTEQNKIVLLDFGATREYSEQMAQAYRKLTSAAIEQDLKSVHQAALEIGLIKQDLPADVQALVTHMCVQACEPVCFQGEYDFGQTDLATRLRDEGMALGLGKAYSHTPHPNAIFLHRKLGGLFFLAIKLKAQVNLYQLFKPYQLHV